MKSHENWIGAWAYTVGVILAIIIGVIVGLNISSFSQVNIYLSGILVILGIVIGSVNVNYRESSTFLLAGAILVIVSRFGIDSVTQVTKQLGEVSVVGTIGASIFNSLLLLFIPATIIVALRALFSVSRV